MKKLRQMIDEEFCELYGIGKIIKHRLTCPDCGHGNIINLNLPIVLTDWPEEIICENCHEKHLLDKRKRYTALSEDIDSLQSIIARSKNLNDHICDMRTPAVTPLAICSNSLLLTRQACHIYFERFNIKDDQNILGQIDNLMKTIRNIMKPLKEFNNLEDAYNDHRKT